MTSSSRSSGLAVSSRANIYDVAARAGVSHTTVSRVLNDQQGVSPATRARVLRAAGDLGFARNAAAVALVTHRARRIGVVEGTNESTGSSRILVALEEDAHRRGYALSSFYLGVEHDELQLRLREAHAQGIDALCVLSPRASVLAALREGGIGVPVVVLSDDVDCGVGAQTIAQGQRAGVEAAVDHLADLGHRVILHLGGPQDDLDARVRKRAWRGRLQARRLEVREPTVGDWSADSGYAFGREYDLGGATAILVANDQMAAGVLHGLAERGIRVPEEVSVVGFGDIPDARHFLPPLTTVVPPVQEVATTLVQALLAAIEGQEPPCALLITPRLIVRSSTGAPRRFSPGGG